jgi:hypothetical protein
VIISFLEDIISRFGCPSRIVTDNASPFRSEPLIKFCEQFQIALIHSTPYYPQGNGLAESSNKSLIKLIKKLLEDNKRAWDSKLRFSLWDDRVTTKKSLGISPFQLVYGIEVVFPTQLALPVANLLQDFEGEPNHVLRRIHQMVEYSRSENRSWTEPTIISRRSSRPLTGKTERKNSSRVTWYLNGMHRGKKRANTVNLMPSGSGLSRSLKHFQTTLTGCRIWKAKKFLAAQSMGIS